MRFLSNCGACAEELNVFLGSFARMPLMGALLTITLLTALGPAQSGPDSHATAARRAVMENHPRAAEREWRIAIASARADLADISLTENQAAEAVSLYQQALSSLGMTKQIALGLTGAYLEMGRPSEAIAPLRKAIAANLRDAALRRAFGKVLATSGDNAQALAQFERAVSLEPKNPETLYLAGSAALKLHDLKKARLMYSALSAAVPGAASHILIGRMYRDFGYRVEATSQLRQALLLDPHIRRAHYYLGTLAVMDDDAVRLDDAKSEFQQELAQYPDDYSSNLYLGVVLSQQRRYAEAETFLLKATALQPAAADGFVFLANGYFEQHHYEQAVQASIKAISLSPDPTKGHYQIANTHYVLAQAWRKLGENAKADEEYSIARRLKQQATDASRNELQAYLRRSVEDTNAGTSADVSVRWPAQPLDPGLADLNRKRRHLLQELVAQVRFDLGLFYIHQQRPQEAAAELADLFQERPDYPGLNNAYATALFLAGKYVEATPLLRQALDHSPGDLGMRRMLAQAYFRAEDYMNTVAVLRDHVWHDIPTQYALATALARGGQDEAAREAFSTLLAEHSDSAELQALLGQAAAQQRDYSAAITYYRQALALDHSVPEAHLGIALIEMRNGQLQASETELQAELRSHPEDFRAKYYLAYLLGLSQKHVEAEKLLRAILSKRPDFPEAHATLGTELLAQNRPAEALEELLIADKLAPSQPKLNYQLGVVYRKLGRSQDAEQAFARYRKLKQHSAGDVSSAQSEDGHE